VVREIYTAAFGTIVAKAHPSSAMCSYSSVNGTYACENAYLNNILKTGFGFDGFITSDWDGTHSTVQSANAGMDMQMPNDSYFGAALKQAVRNGRVAQSRVDDMVTLSGPACSPSRSRSGTSPARRGNRARRGPGGGASPTPWPSTTP
jgi:beta-glucosidase